MTRLLHSPKSCSEQSHKHLGKSPPRYVILQTVFNGNESYKKIIKQTKQIMVTENHTSTAQK